MKDLQKKKDLLMELLNLYAQFEFVETDVAGKASLKAIIKGKEEKFIELAKNNGDKNE